MNGKTATIGPQGYSMGAEGYRGQNRVQLPGLAGHSPSAGKVARTAEADFRRNILFYFANCKVPVPSAGNFASVREKVSTKGQKVGSTVGDLVTGKQPEAHKTISQALSRPIVDALASINENAPPAFAEIARSAANTVGQSIQNALPDLLLKIGNMGVPDGKLKEIGMPLAGAIKKTYTYWQTRGLDQALRAGEPEVIIKALRRELGHEALKQLAESLYAGAKAVAEYLTAGAAKAVTAVIDAIKDFLAYVWKIYKTVRDGLALQKFCEECRNKLRGSGDLAQSAATFRNWLASWIGELPIIASHCVASPACGSYFEFLSAVADESTLKSAYGKFQSLKEPATDFLKNYHFELSSDNPVVSMSLKVIQKGGVDLTNGKAAQSVSWFRRKYMEYGSKIGVTTNTLY